ncbi:MAG: hypothetical protein JSV63_00250, partial [Candidatus Aenigmatarchaeota archaeon]
GIPALDTIYISSNSKFGDRFHEWKGGFSNSKNIEIVVESSTEEENKLGAIGAIGFLLKQKDINDDLLIIAGDNLFDFDVSHFLSSQRGNNPMVALYDMQNKDFIRNKYGVVTLDADGIISNFQEKPDEPLSTLISTGCYFFPKHSVSMIHDYLSNGENPDAPGHFISWLSQQMAVQGFVLTPEMRWYDIGSIESYEEANRIYSEE